MGHKQSDVSGRVLLEDDFSSNDTRWSTGKSTGGTSWIENGMMNARSYTSTNNGSTFVAYDNVFAGQIIEVEMRHIKTGCNLANKLRIE